MAEYLFELSERSRTTAHRGGATSDEEAVREAVQFLGEVLQDQTGLDIGKISVAVMKDGETIYTVGTVSSGTRCEL